MVVRDEVIGRSAIGAVCVFAMLSGGDQAFAQSASGDRPADHSVPVALDAITIGAEGKKTQAPSGPASNSVVSTTTLSADRIGVDRIDSVQRALDTTPNAVFNPQGGPIAIRGIGSLGRTGGVDRQLSVGVFLDDVYIGRPYGIPDHLYGLERIDVVRGPQVTRYGWSTLGGAFNLVSPAPAAKAGASVEGSVSSYGIARAMTTLDAPMIPGSLGAHAFASYGRSSGYVTNDFNGDKILGGENVVGRMSVQGQLGDATMLRLNFDYFHTHDDGDIVLSRVEDALRGHSRYNFPQYRTNDIGGVSARLTHSFDGFDLTSISAFRAFYYDFNLDGDFTPTPFFLQGERQEQQQASQELRLTSTLDGPVSWMAGATYMFEHFKAQQFFGLEAAPSAPDRSRLDQTSSTISGFGQLGWNVTDRLTLSGGLRYTHVSREAAAETLSPLGFGFFGAPTRVAPSASFDNVSPEFSATYRVIENVSGFARISRGFLPGGVSQFIDQYGRANEYQPATSWTYEAGAKTSWLDGRLAFDVAGFYNDITDLQVVQSLSPTTRIVANAGASTSFGMEAEARAKVSDEFTLSAAYGYTRAVFDSFIDFRTGADYSGQDVPFAPRHSASVTLDWRRPIDDTLTFFAGAQYSYKSSYLFVPNSNCRQKDVSLLDARIGIDIGPVTISLYAKNLLNEQYLNGYFLSGGTNYGSRALPRTFGVLARASW